jgi:hypothetical protein
MRHDFVRNRKLKSVHGLGRQHVKFFAQFNGGAAVEQLIYVIDLVRRIISGIMSRN